MPGTAHSQKADSVVPIVDYRAAMGAFGILRPDSVGLAIDMQAIGRRMFWIFQFYGGFLITSYQDVFIFAGVNVPLFFAKYLEGRIGFAPGLYEHFMGPNLGYYLEFRTSFSLGCKFPNQAVLGAELAHISNAGLGKYNPGVEILSVFVQIPVRPMKKSPARKPGR